MSETSAVSHRSRSSALPAVPWESDTSDCPVIFTVSDPTALFFHHNTHTNTDHISAPLHVSQHKARPVTLVRKDTTRSHSPPSYVWGCEAVETRLDSSPPNLICRSFDVPRTTRAGTKRECWEALGWRSGSRADQGVTSRSEQLCKWLVYAWLWRREWKRGTIMTGGGGRFKIGHQPPSFLFSLDLQSRVFFSSAAEIVPRLRVPSSFI